MVTLVYLSLLLAVTGVIGAVCYGRNIPKSVSALVYQYKRGMQWAWSVWLIAVGALLWIPLMERLDDSLCVLGFLAFAFLVGAAVTPLTNRETSDWHDWFGVAAGLMYTACVTVINHRCLAAWALYVAALPFQYMRSRLVLVSEVCCAASLYGVLVIGN